MRRWSGLSTYRSQPFVTSFSGKLQRALALEQGKQARWRRGGLDDRLDDATMVGKRGTGGRAAGGGTTDRGGWMRSGGTGNQTHAGGRGDRGEKKKSRGVSPGRDRGAGGRSVGLFVRMFPKSLGSIWWCVAAALPDALSGYVHGASPPLILSVLLFGAVYYDPTWPSYCSSRMLKIGDELDRQEHSRGGKRDRWCVVGRLAVF